MKVRMQMFNHSPALFFLSIAGISVERLTHGCTHSDTIQGSSSRTVAQPIAIPPHTLPHQWCLALRLGSALTGSWAGQGTWGCSSGEISPAPGKWADGSDCPAGWRLNLGPSPVTALTIRKWVTSVHSPSLWEKAHWEIKTTFLMCWKMNL